MNYQKMAFIGWQYYLLQPEKNTRKKKMNYKKWLTNLGLEKETEKMKPEEVQEAKRSAIEKAEKIISMDKKRRGR